MKRSANFLSNACGAIVPKKEKRKKERLSIARTLIDHDRYRLLSAENSGNALFCIQLLSSIVMYGGQFT